MLIYSGKAPCYFEVRSLSNKNGYNRNGLMDSIMGRQSPPVNIDNDKKFDDALVKRLAKILDALPNLEE